MEEQIGAAKIWPGRSNSGILGLCPVGALTARGQAGLESCSAGCTDLLLFVQLGTTPHLEETMAQPDDESPESLQACVEVSEATLLPVASALPCLTPQPEP